MTTIETTPQLDECQRAAREVRIALAQIENSLAGIPTNASHSDLLDDALGAIKRLLLAVGALGVERRYWRIQERADVLAAGLRRRQNGPGGRDWHFGLLELPNGLFRETVALCESIEGCPENPPEDEIIEVPYESIDELAKMNHITPANVARILDLRKGIDKDLYDEKLAARALAGDEEAIAKLPKSRKRIVRADWPHRPPRAGDLIAYCAENS